MKDSKFLLACFFAVLMGTIMIASASCDKTEVPPGNGYALAIGLNSVDPAHYAGWSGDLTGCEPDARDMTDIALGEGLNAETLLTTQATRGSVLGKLDDLAKELKSGDLLVVSYSGHGGQIPDHNGDEADDGLDETWCLYDGELLDDELHGAWKKFNAGVRILVFSDSCHSGTVLKMIRSDWDSKPQIDKFNADWQRLRIPQKLDRARIRSILKSDEKLRMRIKIAPSIKPDDVKKPETPDEEMEIFFSRSISPLISVMTYNQNRSFYEDIGTKAPREDTTKVEASVILISGCEDHQSSVDIGFNGLFTWMLKQVWDNGNFSGSHLDFHESIKSRVLAENSDQSPKFFEVGEAVESFKQQKPYSVR